MSNHILMLNIPAWGHMRPALAVTEELVRRGHRVSFLSPRGFEEAIRASGATPVRYDSTLEHVLAPGQEAPDQDQNMRLAISFMRESVEVMAQAERLLDYDPPSLIMYDVAVGAAGRALGARWDRPAVQSTPSMASNEHYSHINEVLGCSGVRPDHPAFAELFAWARNFPMELTPAGGRPEKSVVYLPQEFQTAGETFGKETVFVGHSFPREHASAWSPPVGEEPLVIASMGTLHNGDEKFFRTCVEAFRDRPWRVVITLGQSSDTESPRELPSNVDIHPWIPQLAALEKATAFVTAAGLGSLMSALLTGTPPVMIPPVPENVVLAGRAAELGLGTLLAPEDLTADDLFEAVRSLAEDEATRQRVGQMRAAMTQSGGAPRAADALENWL
ncbi:macrolide family glycosyltransferase [Streptomyces sp. NPDC047108]|uniref:macrolide family glycosyltransferase n=1 Tax=Streptomyces sp. NPDC047108 TaxID=3155025 RepID=UPI0033C916DC